MQASTTDPRKTFKPIGAVFFEHVWEESWTYIKTVVDVMREPVLILNKELSVMAANEPFYKVFRVQPKDTEQHHVYELGNGQWNIPALKKLLEDILSKNTFFKGFEVEHEFPIIGRRHILLNARQIHFTEVPSHELAPPIILLAMEDVTEMMEVAETLANHETRLVELVVKLTQRTRVLESNFSEVAKDLKRLKQIAEE